MQDALLRCCSVRQDADVALYLLDALGRDGLALVLLHRGVPDWPGQCGQEYGRRLKSENEIRGPEIGSQGQRQPIMAAQFAK